MPPSVFIGERTADTAAWTSRDTVLAMALEDFEARLCGGCGGDLDETMKIENARDTYQVDFDLCHRCVALILAQQGMADHDHSAALHPTITRKTRTA